MTTIKLPRKVTTWVQGADFGRQVFQFSADVFDTLRALRSAVLDLQANGGGGGGGTPDAHASTHLPVSGSDPLAVGSSADSFCVGNDARLSDDRTASGLRTASSVVSISAAVAPSAGQILVASSSTLAAWRGTTTFAFTAGAATLDVSASLHFAASGALTQDSTITLTNGADGRRGRIHVVQDATGSWRLNFTVAGRTILLNLGDNNTTPQAAVGSHTCYDYAFETIAGVACVVIERKKFTLILPALMDGLTVTPLVAMSTYRKLNSAYTGSAFRVRRASDSAETDIGFLSTGLVDTAALTTFCAGTNGFITTWYDQSGNGRNYTQVTAGSQPKIVNAGSILTMGTSKPAMTFDGTDDQIGRSDASGASGTGGRTAGLTGKFSNEAEVWSIGANSGAGTRWGLFYEVGPTKVWNDHIAVGTNFVVATGANNDNYYVHGYASGANVTQGTMRQNGADLTLSASSGAASINLGNSSSLIGNAVGGSSFSNVTTNCFTLFDSVLAGANLTALESELNTHRS